MIQTAISAAENAAMGEPYAKELWLKVYGRSANVEMAGEKALLLEMMEHTRRGLSQKPGSDVFRECMRWVNGREPDRPFSFDWVCEALEWEPERVRRAMLFGANHNGHLRKVWRRLGHKQIEAKRGRR